MNKNLFFLGSFRNPNRTAKRVRTSLSKENELTNPYATEQQPKLIWIAINGEKSLYLWKYANRNNFEHDSHPLSECADCNASSNYNFRVGFSKILYVGFVSILMKTMENFNGVHTWLKQKVSESFLLFLLFCLLLLLTKLWAHRYTEPDPRTFYTFWRLWTPGRS